MPTPRKTEAFRNLVHTKFSIYNGLFLNLPYQQDKSVGTLIPILYQHCQTGLKDGREPVEILDSFFKNYTQIRTEREKIDFLFRVIQYVERQVVLYDAVEDAAFTELRNLEPVLSFQDHFQLMESGRERKILAERLASFSARIVFTAHPTQFYPPAILDIIDSLRQLIRKNRIDDIPLMLQQLGLTSLLHVQKPTPLEEARNIVYFLRNVYYDAVGDLYTRIKEETGDPNFENHNLIKLGFWPGGDRDGNPSVNFDTTVAVLDLLQTTLMKCYHDDVKRLRKLLTFRQVDAILRQLKETLYTHTFEAAQENIYPRLLEQLTSVRAIVVEKFHGLYLGEIGKLIDKVKLFKTHFAALDIRQDHRVHQQVVRVILKREGIIREQLAELSSEALTEILLENDFSVNADDYDDEIVKDTLRTIAGLRNVQHQYGPDACHRYIISNSEDIFAVLYVYALFRWCGWPTNEAITFDIIPLFETMTGLAQADAIFKALLAFPIYRDHVQRRHDQQTIMLGFSDGTKDGGYLQANWSIFQAKERLSAVAAEQGIRIIFFDGRGGPPARGGGKTYRFYASQSPFIANHEIQLTIQGQTITSKYGTREQFTYQCEQLLTAGLFTNLPGQQKEISKSSRKLLAELAQISYQAYSRLKEHPKFIPYLEQRGTLRYYDKTNIGSRPGRRGLKRELDLSDLRAIPFVGTWSQLKQNIPGYYGMGTALQTLADQGKLDELRQLYQDVPWFKALALNSMMALSKCDFNLTRYMRQDVEFGEFWQMLYDEYERSKTMLLAVSGLETLMADEPVSRESIKIREEIVLPLLVVQQYALQKVTRRSSHQKVYEKIVTRSLYGNINASRNSA